MSLGWLPPVLVGRRLLEPLLQLGQVVQTALRAKGELLHWYGCRTILSRAREGGNDGWFTMMVFCLTFERFFLLGGGEVFLQTLSTLAVRLCVCVGGGGEL